MDQKDYCVKLRDEYEFLLQRAGVVEDMDITEKELKRLGVDLEYVMRLRELKKELRDKCGIYFSHGHFVDIEEDGNGKNV